MTNTPNTLAWIDRIDERGNIRAHVDVGGDRTLCGLRVTMSQDACGNAPCGRCLALVRARGVPAR